MGGRRRPGGITIPWWAGSARITPAPHPTPTPHQVGRLCQDKNWRVRHSTLTLFPKLAAVMGEADFSAEFAGQEG